LSGDFYFNRMPLSVSETERSHFFETTERPVQASRRILTA